MTFELAQASTTVAAVLLPGERPRVDAAGNGCFEVVHRDSIPDAMRVVRERPVDAVLVSVHRCGPDQMELLGTLVREFSTIPTVALVSSTIPAPSRRCSAWGPRVCGRWWMSPPRPAGVGSGRSSASRLPARSRASRAPCSTACRRRHPMPGSSSRRSSAWRRRFPRSAASRRSFRCGPARSCRDLPGRGSPRRKTISPPSGCSTRRISSRRPGCRWPTSPTGWNTLPPRASGAISAPCWVLPHWSSAGAFSFQEALDRFVELMMEPYAGIWREFHPLAAGSWERPSKGL